MISIGTLILVLALLILIHENASATKGYSLRKLENTRSLLLLEQEVLNMQIAQAQSLETLETDPQILAMVMSKKASYAKPEKAVAVKRIVVPSEERLFPWE